MAGEMKRKSYTAEFKLCCVEKAEKLGNREAGRLLGLDEKSLRDWRKNKDILLQSDKNRKAFRGKIANWPQLEEVLFEWLMLRKDSKIQISILDILAKARRIAKKLRIKDFGSKTEWCYRFLKRKNIRICDGKVIDDSVPLDVEERDFFQNLEKSIKNLNCSAADIVILDVISINFGNFAKSNDACESEFHFSVLIACSADGGQLKPLIIFRTKDDPFGEEYPEGVELEANEAGCLDDFVASEWFDLVWKERKGNSPPNGVLIVDFKKAKMFPDSCIKTFAELMVIPEEATKKFQPFASDIVKYFETVLNHFLERQVKSGSLDSSKPNLTKIAEWVKEAWSWVSTRRIKETFFDLGIFEIAPIEYDMDFIEEKPKELFDKIVIKDEPIEVSEELAVAQIFSSESDLGDSKET